MCEILIDDFSLLNARPLTPDAYIETMGSEKGFDLGNSEAVHRVVESFLRFDQIDRIDDWAPKVQAIPIRIHGPHRAAIGDMAARARLALQRPRRVFIVPCDGWGAPSWCRIGWATMEPVSNDYALAPTGTDRFADFTIKLGTEAFAHSMETFSAVADTDIADEVLWDVDVDLDTGWVASGGTITYSAGNYVGVSSDGSALTVDKLENDLVWDGLTYTTIAVEWTATDAGGGGVDYTETEPYMYVPAGVSTFGSKVARVDLGSGWFRDTFLLPDGLTATNPDIGVGVSGSTLDTDLRIRKITLASSAGPGPFQNLWFDVPGSAPTSVDITLTGDADAGLVLYTCPNLPETTLMPIVYEDAAGALWPTGIYHLVVCVTLVGAVTGLRWEVNGETFDGSAVIQSGEVDVADLDDPSANKWTVLANDIVLPVQALPAGRLAEASITITNIGGTSVTVHDTLLLWMGNPLTGENSPAYTLLNLQAGRSIVRVEAPSPERPVWGVFGGNDVDELYQEHRTIVEVGRHDVRPGRSRVFLALAAAAAAEVLIEAEGYPAWDYLVPPKSRWPSS